MSVDLYSRLDTSRHLFSRGVGVKHTANDVSMLATNMASFLISYPMDSLPG